MKKLIAIVGLLVFAGVSRSFADTCTGTVTVTGSSTQIVAASDVVGGRNYLLLQNIGSNDVFCSIGTAATTTSGFFLATLGHGSIVFLPAQGPSGVVKSVPNATVNCIAAASTTLVSVCDY